MSGWTTADIPAQDGRLAIVTGTGGLGFETALALARAGATVILAGRNADKGTASIRRIKAEIVTARVQFETLDLADLDSVADCGARIRARHDCVDLLINNAGVMAPPVRKTTKDGFELQFGTNYLGHFALTAHLLPLLRKSIRPRVVNLSSLAHRRGAIHFDDPQWKRAYKPFPAYCQSKLAMLMFALELQHRSDTAGWGLMSNASHPGFARTELIANGVGNDALLVRLGRLLEPLVSQTAAGGALPTLFAATSPDATGGGYYGPDGFFELIGAPKSATIMKQARDPAANARLWALSADLTGVSFGPR